MDVRHLPLLLIATMACTPPDPDGGVRLEGSDYLDGHEDLRERARPLVGAVGHFADGPRFDGEGLGYPRTFTVADVGEELVLVHSDREVELAIWLEREEFALTAAVPTWSGIDGTGVQLPAGAELDVVDEDDDRVRIQARSRVMEIDTWVPRDRLEPYWIDEAPAEREHPTTGHAIGGGTTFLDAPGGEPIGRLLPLNDDGSTAPYYPVEVVEQSAGWIRIRGYQDWPFDAWVHEDAVRAGFHGFSYGSSSCGCGGAYGRGPGINVAADTPLYAAIDGTTVGRTRTDVYWDLQEEPRGWLSARTWTPLGTATLFIAPEDRI